MKIKEALKENTEKTLKAVKPKVANLVSDAKDYAVNTAAPALKEAAEKTKDYAVNTAAPAIKDAAVKTKDKTVELAKNAKTKTIETIDLNGDGKVDQEDMLILLNDIYGKSLDGIKNVSKPVKEICDEYLNRYADPREAAAKLIVSDITKCTTSGFLSGLGGAIALPVALAAIPANITNVLYVQIRMISSIAYLSGLDVNSDATRTLVYACLAGVSVADLVKNAGINLGGKLAINAIEKIPGKALAAINNKVGFRLITKFGEKGIINLGKMVPLLGGIIGGGFDYTETKLIANRAVKEFFDGDFEIKEDENKDAIDVEFNKITEYKA